MKKNIFVALDFSNFEKALDIANSVKNDAAGLKITNELFAICGKEGLKKLSDFGLEIFLDLKILDIPNTVKKTVASIASLKTVKYLTVHTSGDSDMLKAAKESSGQLELLGVTVLTSQLSSKDKVKTLTDLAIKSGLSGVIASAQEYDLVRLMSKDLKIFCPGIRGEGDKKHDQKRVMSYNDFSKIADDNCFAVIGRPIIEGDPVQNIKKIIQSVK